MPAFEQNSDTNFDERKSKNKLGRLGVYYSRAKRRVLKHVGLVRIAILLALISIVGIIVYFGYTALKNTKAGFYSGLARDFLLTPKDKINSIDGRTNVLILGKGGEGHEAPELTDSMMLMSLNHNNPKITLISLPRDIWVPELKAKINSVYYWGNRKQPGGGLILAKSVVEEVLGQPVQYVVILDFSGFKKIIDVLGGVQVDVQNEFTDTKYPIAGKENDLCGGDSEYKCRYETIHFGKGLQLMDGETTLKFVRSRNAEGDEGTDLARAARQQKVIEGVKNKVLSRQTLFSPKKLSMLQSAALDSVETDASPEVGAIMARRVLQAGFEPTTHVLSEDLLEIAPRSPVYENLYVFLPKDGSWGKTHEWVKCVLSEGCE